MPVAMVTYTPILEPISVSVEYKHQQTVAGWGTLHGAGWGAGGRHKGGRGSESGGVHLLGKELGCWIICRTFFLRNNSQNSSIEFLHFQRDSIATVS